MGLDRDLKERIRHAFDYDYGGRLTEIANRALTIDAPILIIGLGGTGADAVIRIKKRIYDCFRRDQNDQVDDTEKPENIEYLVMDSDPGYAKISCGGVGFTESLHECLIFREDGLVSSLKNVETPDYIRNWINPELRHLLYNSNCSSACIRQVGRLSFFYNIAWIKDVLENKIKKVTSNYSNDVPLHVFILSGVCGATGGGTFIDVAYIVRALSEAIDNSRWVNRIGLLFMPDVNMGMHSINSARREILKKNGFAALKELDYLMKI